MLGASCEPLAVFRPDGLPMAGGGLEGVGTASSKPPGCFICFQLDLKVGFWRIRSARSCKFCLTTTGTQGPASLVSLFRLMAVAFENGQIHQAKWVKAWDQMRFFRWKLWKLKRVKAVRSSIAGLMAAARCLSGFLLTTVKAGRCWNGIAWQVEISKFGVTIWLGMAFVLSTPKVILPVRKEQVWFDDVCVTFQLLGLFCGFHV